MAAARKQEAHTEPPSRFPEGPPETTSGPLPLTAVMEIARTIGGLSRSVETLTTEQRELREKLNEIDKKVHTAQTVVWVVGVMLTLAIGFAGWLITNAIRLLPQFIQSK